MIFEVEQAHSAEHIEQVPELFLEYQASLDLHGTLLLTDGYGLIKRSVPPLFINLSVLSPPEAPAWIYAPDALSPPSTSPPPL